MQAKCQIWNTECEDNRIQGQDRVQWHSYKQCNELVSSTESSYILWLTQQLSPF